MDLGQVGSKTGFISLVKSTMTMEGLTKELLKKALIECKVAALAVAFGWRTLVMIDAWSA